MIGKINPDSLYGKYIKGKIEPSELSKADFNVLMIQWYTDYKSRNGEKTFQEFVKGMEYIL